MHSSALRLATCLALLLTALLFSASAQAADTPTALAQALNAGRSVQRLPALPVAKAASSPQAQMFSAMNAARARNGVPVAGISKSLTVASTRYAQTLAKEHLFQHATRIRTSRAYSVVGEILARSPGKRASIDPIVQAWLDSPVHRPILLGSEFQQVGLGMSYGKYDGQWWTVWVVRFGKF
jgi:uncharacterized protein YkwD